MGKAEGISTGGAAATDTQSMRSWVFRNRRRLEAIYGGPGRGGPATEAGERSLGAPRPPADAGERANLPILVYEMIPFPRRPLRQAG